MDELEKQLNEMLVDEARNIFEMLIRNGDKDEERFTSIQLSIVHANRTADTIQVFLFAKRFGATGDFGDIDTFRIGRNSRTKHYG